MVTDLIVEGYGKVETAAGRLVYEKVGHVEGTASTSTTTLAILIHTMLVRSGSGSGSKLFLLCICKFILHILVSVGAILAYPVKIKKGQYIDLSDIRSSEIQPCS